MIPISPALVRACVERALAEDLGHGDWSLAAVPAGREARAVLTVQEPGRLCGRPFVEAVFEQLGGVSCEWRKAEGEALTAGEEVVSFCGPAATLLQGERTAINFLQTLSGTATTTAELVATVAGTGARVLDTRKTLPGLRSPQKYAVRVGGGHNHRHGLYDGVLLKENHLAWAGGMEKAVTGVREQLPHTLRLQVEVEDLDQYRQALACGVDALLLDNFSLADLGRAVAQRPQGTFLEASGDIGPDNARKVAETGVDAISVGALTRDLASLDFSLRYRDPEP